jgi:phosphoribosyl-ATP pyrophosphohydrolase
MRDFLRELEAIIQRRKVSPVQGSYTNMLFEAGRPRMAQKVGEEGVELAVASLSQGKTEQVGEAADLLYHTLVLLTDLGISLDEVMIELERRHQPD